MIAIDTNILVYAHRRDSSWHQRADACLAARVEASLPWAIPWPCLHEFLAVVTHPRVYSPPTPLVVALDQVECWLESASLVLLAEPRGYWSTLRQLIEESQVVGARVHDGRVAALCVHHGVSELWSADRDFGRFRSLKVVNPLIDG